MLEKYIKGMAVEEGRCLEVLRDKCAFVSFLETNTAGQSREWQHREMLLLSLRSVSLTPFYRGFRWRQFSCLSKPIDGEWNLNVTLVFELNG
jgi:hypothetical protein